MIRDNWRVILLVIFILASAVALFVPGGAIAGGSSGDTADAPEANQTSDGPTNLQFGLELSGGTRVRAPVVGMTAENVQVGQNQTQIEQTVANELGVEVIDVSANPRTNTVEVFSDVSRSEFAAAVSATGASVSEDDVREGVTQQTRDTMVKVIESKIDESGLSGGRVQEVTTSTGEHFIIIEMPNANRSQVQDLVDSRGTVSIVAQYPGENGTQNRTVLEQDDFAGIGVAQQPEGRQPEVPVTVREDAAGRFQQDMVDLGFTNEGVQSCHGVPADQRYCLNTVVDDEVVYSASMTSSLASDFESGQFVNDPGFVMTATNMSEARSLQINLRAGALPAPLDLEDEGTSYFLSPSLAEEFKIYSLITGLVAALAVAGMVFIRYGDPKVAAPMFVTAISEVFILLGFAAGIGLPLDLSHIAGFIAVIGTGVDDLVIIADEVMAEGDVRSNRVFQSRFRKAFWVIGAAAATTIVAMSPLAILSLGDLRGFAIITILGVLIGVLVTRPAYGDILRHLLTDDR